MTSSALLASLRTLLSETATAAGVQRPLIVSADRTAPVVRARFAYCWAASHGLGASSRAIGQALGSRSHPTILHALRRAEALRDADTDFRSLSDRLLPISEEAIHDDRP